MSDKICGLNITKFLVIGLFIGLIFITNPVVEGATPGFSVVSAFSKNPAVQGDIIDFTITAANTFDRQERITWVGIHLDWQANGIYFAKDLTSNPEYVASTQATTFTINVEVPSNVLTGSHAYDIRIDYESENWYGGWDKQTWQSVTETDFRVNEKTSPPPGGGGTGGTNSGADMGLALGVIILVVVVCVISAVVLATRRKKQPSQVQQKPSMVHSAQAVVNPQTRYCTSCGKSMPLDFKFCPYCGK